MCQQNNTLLNETTENQNVNDISRYKSREQAFLLYFESLFSPDDIEEIADNAIDGRDLVFSDYALNCVKGIKDNQEKIDELILSKLKKGWKLQRISKVCYTTLCIAIYEMLCVGNIPSSVSINEAVELTKKYAYQEDASFVNGVLGSVEKELSQNNQ